MKSEILIDVIVSGARLFLSGVKNLIALRRTNVFCFLSEPTRKWKCIIDRILSSKYKDTFKQLHDVKNTCKLTPNEMAAELPPLFCVNLHLLAY